MNVPLVHVKVILYGVFPAPDGTIYLVDINGTRYFGSI